MSSRTVVARDLDVSEMGHIVPQIAEIPDEFGYTPPLTPLTPGDMAQYERRVLASKAFPMDLDCFQRTYLDPMKITSYRAYFCKPPEKPKTYRITDNLPKREFTEEEEERINTKAEEIEDYFRQKRLAKESKGGAPGEGTPSALPTQSKWVSFKGRAQRPQLRQDAPLLSKDSYCARKENSAEAEKSPAQEPPLDQKAPQNPDPKEDKKDTPAHEAPEAQKTQAPSSLGPSPKLGSLTAQDALSQSAQTPRQGSGWVSSVAPSQRLLTRETRSSSFTQRSLLSPIQGSLQSPRVPAQKTQGALSQSLTPRPAQGALRKPPQTPRQGSGWVSSVAPSQKSAPKDGVNAASSSSSSAQCPSQAPKQGSGWVAVGSPGQRVLQQPDLPPAERPGKRMVVRKAAEAPAASGSLSSSSTSSGPIDNTKISSPMLGSVDGSAGGEGSSELQSPRWGGFVKAKHSENNLGFLTLRRNQMNYLRADGNGLSSSLNPSPRVDSEQAAAPIGEPSAGWKAYHGRNSKNSIVVSGK